MKKLLVCLLAFSMLFALAACKTEPEAPPPAVDTPPAGDTTPTPTPDVEPPPVESTSIKVDVFWYDFSDAFLATVRDAMTTAFGGYPDLQYTHYDCQNNQANETQMVETAVSAGSNLLIVNIVDTASSDAANNIVDIAKNAGIPLIFFNREPEDSVVNSYDACCFVGTDPDEAGYMQGKAVADFLLDGDNLGKYDINGDGKINYIVLRGEHGNPEALGRTRYSVTEANRLLAGKCELTPSPANTKSDMYEQDVDNYFLYANWSGAEAKVLMDTALAQYRLDNGDIELILANNDDAALGAIESLNEADYNTGSADKMIPVFGVDATDPAKQAISDGKMTGTVLQDAVGMGSTIVVLANNVAQNMPVFNNATSYGNVDSTANKIRIPYQIVS